MANRVLESPVQAIISCYTLWPTTTCCILQLFYWFHVYDGGDEEGLVGWLMIGRGMLQCVRKFKKNMKGIWLQNIFWYMYTFMVDSAAICIIFSIYVVWFSIYSNMISSQISHSYNL